MQIGDIVARNSYRCDIFFKVIAINNTGDERIATLKGISYRIEADAPESDLIVQSDQRVNDHNFRLGRLVERKSRDVVGLKKRGYSKKSSLRSTPKDKAVRYQIPGKVLHLDGDSDYLDTCLAQYKKFGIEATGKPVRESDQASAIYKLLVDNKPDLLVLTGHDGYIRESNNYMDLVNYRNSKYFIDAVKEARRYCPDKDCLVIFAGACQSMYEGIIKAGANFASSPYRVLIHALDPVFVCQKIASSGINKLIDPQDVILGTITGFEGIGGIQTLGRFREGFPADPYN